MYLSQLELIGFKSFAKRTKIRFHPGVTGIVGPNGCGKSNIVDAVRWVMGEQKGSILRSERMEQVIFNGSESRRPLGMAEVNLTIENNQEILPSEYSEITIARRLYRNGESEYLFNREKTRLKDIIDLFLDTGLGANSYGLISPELVSRILTEDPYERRSLFEEAAGIAKYKLRVKTAKRRLETVNDNLDRLIDILTEVESNVRSLKRQYNAAKRYEELREKNEEIGTTLLALERNGLVDELDRIHSSMNDTRHRLGRRREDRRSVEEILKKAAESIGQSEENISSIRSEWENHRARTVNLENRLLLIDEKERNEVNQRERTIESIQRAEQSGTFLKERLNRHQSSLEILQKEVEGMKRKAEEAAQAFESSETELNGIRADLKSDEEKTAGFRSGINDLEREKTTCTVKIASIKERDADLASEKKSITDDLAGLKERRDALEGEKNSLDKARSQIESDISGLEEELEKLRKERKGAEVRRSSLEIKLEKRKSELQFLKSLLESGGGIPEGAVNLLAKKPQGIIESVGNLLGVKPEHVPAVEAALGEAVNFIVSESRKDGAEALSILKSGSGGRATIIPLDSRFPLERPQEPPGAGALGAADSLVECDSRYRELVSFLLGGVLVVESLEAAQKVRDSGDWKGLIVTLEGEALGEFTLSGGRSGEKYPAVGRKRRIGEITAEIESIMDKMNSVDAELKETDGKLSSLEKAMLSALENRRRSDETLKRIVGEIASVEAETAALRSRMVKIESEKARLAEEKSSEEAKLADITGKSNSAGKELAEVEKVLNERRQLFRALNDAASQKREELHRRQLKLTSKSGELDKLKSEISLAKSRAAELEEEIGRYQRSLVEIEGRIAGFAVERDKRREEIESSRRQRDEWKDKLAGAEEKHLELKSEYRSLEEKLREASSFVENLSEELSAYEIQAAEIKSKITAKDEAALDKFGVDLEEVDIEEGLDKADLEREMAKLKQKLESIGPVNLLALEEYGKQQERFDFLQSEYEDIVKSKEELLETITKTNVQARARFKEVFRQVADNFRLLFCDLFEGGEGELSLDEGDPLEAEILLKANPAGKKLVNLNQLSGGEKTMTAIALIFALYQVKPSPFCILDEVDAPLDDANIKRFLKLIHRFSPQTQFILITHNKLTMEACDYLFGVTMEEEGLSKVISVEIESASRMVEAG